MISLTDAFLVDSARFDGPVLVTGAGGCIGAWTVAILAKSGAHVIASDLTKSPARASPIMGKEEAQALDWVALDVTEGSAVTDLVMARGVRAIIHLAGLQVPFCVANPALGARVNVEGTINILEAARHADITRTVFASSVAAHAFPAGGPFKETLYGPIRLRMNKPPMCIEPIGGCLRYGCVRTSSTVLRGIGHPFEECRRNSGSDPWRGLRSAVHGRLQLVLRG